MAARKTRTTSRDHGPKGTPQGWLCAGCGRHHDNNRERWEVTPGRWLCFQQYDKELNNRLADERDTLA